MKKILTSLFLLGFSTIAGLAQSVLITPGSSQANIIASGTSNGGIAPPRLTNAQIMAITSPTLGSMVYDTDAKCLRVFDGVKWVCQSEDPNPIKSAVGFGAAGDQIGYDIKVIGDYVYIVGEFTNELYFYDDYGPIYLYSSGGKDGFVAKLRKNGVAEWVKQISNSLDCAASQVNIDPLGNVFIGGTNKGGVTVGTITLSNVDSSNDIFFAKYNAAGTFQWVQTMQGAGNDTLTAMVMDNYYNFHFTGSFESNLNLITANGATGATFNSLGATDMFYAHYSSSGTLIRQKQIGTAGFDKGTCLAVSAITENVYLGGSTNDNLTINSFSFTASDNNSTGFIAVLNSSLACINLNGTESTEPDDILLDATNNVYITSSKGVITGSFIPFDVPIIKIAKYSVSLLNLWKRYGIANSLTGLCSNSPSLYELAENTKTKLSLSPDGKLYLATSYFCTIEVGASIINFTDGSVTSYSDTVLSKILKGVFDGILIEFNTAGDILDLQAYGGSSNDRFMSLSISPDNELFATGFYSGTVNWGSNSTTSTSGKDVMLFKIVK